jgi:hypothetical protein
MLRRKLGKITQKSFTFKRYDQVLCEVKKEQGVVYGNAFILCATKHYGYEKKHQNHLALLEEIFSGYEKKILESDSLKELFLNLRALPLLGDFMAYQIAIDLNYSELFDFDENDFTIAGPGALRGIKKCFLDLQGKNPSAAIYFMVGNQNFFIKKYGFAFKSLFGRELKAIDCQGLFCEVDKYTRVSHPDLKSGRVRIKSRYHEKKSPIAYFYPPNWKLN